MAFLHLYFVLCPNRLETGIQNEMIGGNSDFFRYSFVLSGEVVSPFSCGPREGDVCIGIAEVADNSNSFSGNSAKIEGASLISMSGWRFLRTRMAFHCASQLIGYISQRVLCVWHFRNNPNGWVCVMYGILR